MKIKFRQGWSDLKFNNGDFQFLRFSWYNEILIVDKTRYISLEITFLNLSIQIDIG